MSVNVALLGLPGAGKGTHGEVIADTYDVPHISTGDILRANKEYETASGETVGEIIDGGNMVSDETMRTLLDRELDGDDGFVLDGYPRNPAQAETLDAIADVDVALYLDIPVDEVYRRTTNRRHCGDCGETYHLLYDPPAEDDTCDIDGGALVQRKDDAAEHVRSRVVEQWPKLRRTLTYYDHESPAPLEEVSTDRAYEEARDAILDAVAEHA